MKNRKTYNFHRDLFPLYEYRKYIFSLNSCCMGNQTRTSRPEVFCEKGVLRSFAKFTGKCRSVRPN